MVIIIINTKLIFNEVVLFIMNKSILSHNCLYLESKPQGQCWATNMTIGKTSRNLITSL